MCSEIRDPKGPFRGKTVVGPSFGFASFGKEGKMNNRQNINAGASMTAGPSWLNILLGIWVIISPFVVQFAQLPAAMWNNVILGIWMIISPFALGVMTTAIVSNNIILGIVIALIASGSASLRAPATA